VIVLGGKRKEEKDKTINGMNREEEYRRRIKELDLIWRINENIASFTSLDDFLQMILKASIELMDATSGSIMLIDPPESDTLVIRASQGLRTEVVKNVRKKVGEGIAGMVAKRREGMLLLDDLMDPALRTRRKVSDALSVPIISGSVLLGVLNLNTRKDRAFNEHDLFILNTLTRQIAAGIERGENLESLRRRLGELERMERQVLKELNRLTLELERKKARYLTISEEKEKLTKKLREMTKPVV
jgi:signal transduction protein with GAF and PtsI domain